MYRDHANEMTPVVYTDDTETDHCVVETYPMTSEY